MKLTNPFRMPTAAELDAALMEESRRELHRHQKALEQELFAVAMYKARIKRLESNATEQKDPK